MVVSIILRKLVCKLVSVKPKGVWNTPTTHERIRL